MDEEGCYSFAAGWKHLAAFVEGSNTTHLPTKTHAIMESNITSLLNAPLWQMTGEQFLVLTQFALSSSSNGTLGGTPETGIAREKAVGARQLAQLLGCSESMVYALMHDHVLDGAIVSRIGKKVVFDVETARHLADDYQKAKRQSRIEEKLNG